jgi:hypothetical protein
MQLNMCIEIFGFWEGLRIYIRWHFLDPIKYKYYEISGSKEWCPWAGWYCTDKKCTRKHHSKAPKEKDYPITKDMDCEYCGEAKATERIWNPNHPDDAPFYWRTCKNCVEVINMQEQIDMHAKLMNTAPTEEIRDKAESNFVDDSNKLKELLKKKNIDATCISIQIDENGNSVFNNLLK